MMEIPRVSNKCSFSCCFVTYFPVSELISNEMQYPVFQRDDLWVCHKYNKLKHNYFMAAVSLCWLDGLGVVNGYGKINTGYED